MCALANGLNQSGRRGGLMRDDEHVARCFAGIGAISVMLAVNSFPSVTATER